MNSERPISAGDGSLSLDIAGTLAAFHNPGDLELAIAVASTQVCVPHIRVQSARSRCGTKAGVGEKAGSGNWCGTMVGVGEETGPGIWRETKAGVGEEAGPGQDEKGRLGHGHAEKNTALESVSTITT